MIEHSTLKTILKAAPNYHVVSRGIVARSLTLCPCKVCQHSELMAVRNDALHLCCGRIVKRLGADSAGLAIVSECGTCDAAELPKSDLTNYRLEAENA